MDDQPRDYTVGYGKPPVETRFQKGQSGNPEGRPRGTKKLVTLLAEVLSQRSGLPNPDGSWMTKAEAIFFSLANQASSPDLKAKKLLFDVLIKLQQANICFASDRLPEIQLDQSEGSAHDEVAAEIDRLAAVMSRDAAAREQAPAERTPDAQSAEGAGTADPARMQ
jgi:hypothetical protein